MSNLATKISEHIDRRILNGELSNDDIVYICKQIMAYLNPTPVSEYAKQNNMSRQGVYKYRKIITLFGKKVVIEND